MRIEIRPGMWSVHDAVRGDGQTITHVTFPTKEFIHDGKVCDGVAVSFAPVEGAVDVEVLATADQRAASPEPLAPQLERDDLLLIAARAIVEEVARGS